MRVSVPAAGSLEYAESARSFTAVLVKEQSIDDGALKYSWLNMHLSVQQWKAVRDVFSGEVERDMRLICNYPEFYGLYHTDRGGVGLRC